jgi:hypothetical protein
VIVSEENIIDFVKFASLHWQFPKIQEINPATPEKLSS